MKTNSFHANCEIFLQISFGRDFEQQLGFYVEARASFSNVDAILVYLIQVWAPQPLPPLPCAHCGSHVVECQLSCNGNTTSSEGCAHTQDSCLCASMCRLLLHHYPLCGQHPPQAKPLPPVWEGSHCQRSSLSRYPGTHQWRLNVSDSCCR